MRFVSQFGLQLCLLLVSLVNELTNRRHILGYFVISIHSGTVVTRPHTSGTRLFLKTQEVKEPIRQHRKK